MMDIPLSKLCYQKSIFHPLFITSVTSSQPCFTLVMITFVTPNPLPPHEDNGERLLTNVTIREVEDIEKSNRERYQNQSYIFDTGTGKLEKIISYSQHVDHQEPVTNEENKTNDDLYKLIASIGHQGPPKAPDPNLNRCKYNVHVEWETEEKTHEPLPVLATNDPVTCASYTKGNVKTRFKDLVQGDKHDLSCIASPKGEIKVLSVGLASTRSTGQALYVLVNLHLESSIK